MANANAEEPSVAVPVPVRRISADNPETVELAEEMPEDAAATVKAAHEPPAAAANDPDGMDELEELLAGLEDDEDDEGGAFANLVDEDSAQRGKWFQWKALGPHARLKIARRHNDAESKQWDAVVNKHGDSKNSLLSWKVRNKWLPVIMAKTVVTGSERVLMMSSDPEEQREWLEKGQAVVRRKVKGKPFTFRFSLHAIPAAELSADEWGRLHPSIQWFYAADASLGDHDEEIGGNTLEITRYVLACSKVGQTYMIDSQESRLRLLRIHRPDLQNEVHEVASESSNFRDPDDDAVAGN